VKFFARICTQFCLGELIWGRDCTVYFKRMRASAEFEDAKEEFEGFVKAQGLDW
jgi:hypothetical protein